MSTRRVGLVVEPVAHPEAPFFTIGRMIGGDRMELLDPFLLLDHMQMDAEGTEVVGFLRHPHRGIETLTYVFEGQVHHKDSLGNDSRVGAGGAQWMCAGGGIFHEEYLEPVAAGNDALQIWFNLPAAQKLKPAAYAAVAGDALPVASLAGGVTVRVIAGEIGGVKGAFDGIGVKPTYLDISLPAGAAVTLPAPEGETAFAFLHRGEVVFGEADRVSDAPRLAIFSERGDLVQATAGDAGARFVFASAQPLREPVIQYRTIVMNSAEEMRQALEDLEQGVFERKSGG